ncbi:uncharacterized protein [Littorina saxatilis]|uniref:Uncharacterized protein n=1 Tax=Littorina saxatilis TaxID=31220 RepID=A0AAN9B1I5_9CAEN
MTDTMKYVLLSFTLLVLVGAQDFEIGSGFDGGELCTAERKKCLAGIPCIYDTCVCPPGTKGDGMVECVHTDEHLCIVKGNFQLQGFGNNDFVRYVYPCPTRLAEFTVTIDPDSNEPIRRCTFDVQTTPLEKKNINRIVGLEVKLTLTAEDLDRPFDQLAGNKPNELTALKFDLPLDGYNGFFKMLNAVPSADNTDDVLFPLDNSTHVTWRGINVYCAFDTENNFAVLNVPECSTRIKVRPYDMTLGDRDSEHVPAISIQVPGHTEWNADHGSENALCGKATDRPMKYALMAERLRLNSARTVALHYTLLQGSEVSLSGSSERMCEYPEATLSTCPEENRVMAIRYCGSLMTSYFYRTCLVKHAFLGSTASLLHFFDECLKFFCEGSHHSCLAVREVVTKFCREHRSQKLIMTLNDFCNVKELRNTAG